MDTIVKARIDEKVKSSAQEALEKMGLSLSDAIRILLMRVADEKKLPFEVRVPNAATLQAMQEVEAGKGKKHESLDALYKELEI